MSIKLRSIGEYSSTQVLRVSTRVLRNSRVKLMYKLKLT